MGRDAACGFDSRRGHFGITVFKGGVYVGFGAEMDKHLTRGELFDAVQRFRDTKAKAARIVSAMFPIGSVVFTGSRKHPIWGIVHCEVADSPDRLGILHENGNVWDRSADELVRIDDREGWPWWLKEHFKNQSP